MWLHCEDRCRNLMGKGSRMQFPHGFENGTGIFCFPFSLVRLFRVMKSLNSVCVFACLCMCLCVCSYSKVKFRLHI